VSPQPQRLVSALDLGSTRVVALIAEVTGDVRDPGARILGVGLERSPGIRRGVVRDIEETTRAIDKAMKSAQRMAGVEVGSVFCGIAGEHVAGRSSHGMVSVTGDEIRTSDVARVNDMASNVSFGRDHELLHAIPQDYLIDQQGGINEPIGMTGSRLEAEVYLVTVLSSVLQNLKKCVERAGYHVAEFVLEPLAASLAVLTPDEIELGCAIVELGGGSTNVSIFHNGKIRHTGSLLCAGGHVTGDIVHGLQVTQHDAERLKERHGAGFEPLVPESDVIELPSTPGQGPRTAQRRVLAHIMHMRLQEVLEYALDEVTREHRHVLGAIDVSQVDQHVGAHRGARAFELRLRNRTHVAVDNHAVRDDVGLAEGCAAIGFAVVRDVRPALYRSGVECQVLLAANFLLELIENSCRLENGAMAGAFVEYFG